MTAPFCLIAWSILSAFCTRELSGQHTAKRALVSSDYYRIKDVGPPEISPDGKWVAYTVTSADSAKDRSDVDVWMASWDASSAARVTTSDQAEHSPRWSPDGRYLSFLSARQGEGGTQLWLLDRAGGEAERATDLKGGIQDYAWAPDGKRVVLVVQDAESAVPEPDPKTPKPIVVDRWLFKRDVVGYVGRKRSHLYLFDLSARKSERLTSGDFDDLVPAWSPDGRWIAFESKREVDPKRRFEWALFVMEPRVGAEMRLLATFAGWGETPSRASGPSWSNDGRSIALAVGSDPKYWQYNNARLAIIPASGGTPAVLTEALDRQVYGHRWTTDGRAILAMLEDDRSVHLARIGPDGSSTRLTKGPLVVTGFSVSADGKIAVTSSSDNQAGEISAFEGDRLRRLTRHNDSLISAVNLASVEEFTSTSKDGTVIRGLLHRPPDRARGPGPLVVLLHGGPFGQNQHEFDLRRHAFALEGLAVLSINYRGSSGRGEAFSRAIHADWGNKEVQDVLGAVDQAVGQGIADPARLGIGGWSYGGILTNYTIATDSRFKAAVSGAGVANWLTVYGTDQFVALYETELGHPWTNLDGWLRVSYPFFHADRIKTPTLFLGGENDFNVPIAGGEQMYQALRTLGVETELVIYPGMFHGPTRPSYRIDIMNRFLAWWSRYLRTTTQSP